MRLAQVIGRLTLSVQDPSYRGGRWLLLSPLAASQLTDACHTPPALSPSPSLVAWDDLGAHQGDIVGVVEGAEATAPFDFPIPIDAITVAIFESIHYQPAP